MQNDKKSNIIIHFTTLDKFTTGYINFFKKQFTNYIHYFFLKGDYSFIDNSLVDYENVIKYGNRELISDRKKRKLIKMSDKIIISGFFDKEKLVLALGNQMLKKTYIHFWGGDFYSYREKKTTKSIKQIILNAIYIYALKKCRAAIFLINFEDRYFERITGIKKKKVYIAKMPPTFDDKIDYESLIKEKCNNRKKRIIIGNSAARENNHIEAFKLVESIIQDDVEVVCPLSYGDTEDYIKSVITEGHRVFGNRFFPIQEYMTREEYVKLLNTCKVGIYNNDRQQALGNIKIMLSLGKKVYLRNNTSMYYELINYGYKVFPIESLSKEMLMFDFLNDVLFDNINLFKKESQNLLSTVIDQWDEILKS